jgi:hypothetical protein
MTKTDITIDQALSLCQRFSLHPIGLGYYLVAHFDEIITVEWVEDDLLRLHFVSDAVAVAWVLTHLDN